MTREHWHEMKQLLEDARTDIDEIADTVHRSGTQALVSNIRQYLDDMYTICERDCTDDLPQGYEEVWPMLPDGDGLSVGDMNRLKEHIEAWKRGE
jgi:hypothetical protein